MHYITRDLNRHADEHSPLVIYLNSLIQIYLIIYAKMYTHTHMHTYVSNEKEIEIGN